MKNRIIFVVTMILLSVVISKATAQLTCSVEVAEDQYHITVKSDDARTPISTSTVDVPERTPIVHDSYFNACIVYGDENGTSTQKPVQNALVTLWGYPNKEWGIDVNTTETGCFDAKIPSDSNFTMKVMNPETKEFAKLSGTILSANVGKLLSEAKQKIIPFPNSITYEVQDGVTEHIIEGNTLTFKGAQDTEKHSIIAKISTVVGEEYVVSMAINKVLWVWFGDGVREPNPAKLTGDRGLDHVIKLDSFIAKETETRLYLQPQTNDEIIIKDITVSIEE